MAGVAAGPHDAGRQLGDGMGGNTSSHARMPVAVGTLPGVLALAAGGTHTCAVLRTHRVACWGSNRHGELGNGTQAGSKTPAAVSGLTTARAIAAGYAHTCVRLAGGGVRCWGRNDFYQLGDGTTTNRRTPVAVSGLSGVDALAAGDNHTCALSGDRRITCWGSNASGQVGDGTTLRRPTPVAVRGLEAGVLRITAGGWHTCASLSGGATRCWGSNAHGKLGDGTSINRSLPTMIHGLR